MPTRDRRAVVHELAWHYTTGRHLRKIRAAGFLRLATAFVPDNVRPCVWFTTADVEFEPTAEKATMSECGRYTIALNAKETEYLGDGLVRIGVSTAVANATWKDYRKLSGDAPRMLRATQDIARRTGSDIYRWRLSWQPVPREKWVTIQILDEAGWRDIDDDEEPKRRASTPKPSMATRLSDPRVQPVSDVIAKMGDLVFRDDVVVRHDET